MLSLITMSGKSYYVSRKLARKIIGKRMSIFSKQPKCSEENFISIRLFAEIDIPSSFNEEK